MSDEVEEAVDTVAMARWLEERAAEMSAMAVRMADVAVSNGSSMEMAEQYSGDARVLRRAAQMADGWARREAKDAGREVPMSFLRRGWGWVE